MPRSFEADYGGVTPVEGGGGFCIRVPGPHLAQVIKADPYMSKNGNPATKVDYRIVAGDFEGKEVRYQNVTFLPKTHKWAGMALHFLKQMREPYEGKFKVTPGDWVGKHIWITLGVEADNKGIDRNTIVNLKAPSIEELDRLGEEPAEWQVAKANGSAPVGNDVKPEAPKEQATATAAPKRGRPPLAAKPKPEPVETEADEIPF